MSEFFSSLLLGIVQGATEFIPVSSSGHLIVVREIFGIPLEGTLLFDVILHTATLAAVCVYFRKDVYALLVSLYRCITFQALPAEKRFIGFVGLATVPAVVLGLLFGDFFESVFRSSNFVALALILGSFLMWYAERRPKTPSDITFTKSVIIGVFQSLALIPGFSRSGSTISGGMLVGLSRDQAVRFSFLLSVPIISGAALKGLLDLSNSINTIGTFSLITGLVAAFFVGLASIHFLVTYLRQKSLSLFAWYRVVLAILIIAFL